MNMYRADPSSVLPHSMSLTAVTAVAGCGAAWMGRRGRKKACGWWHIVPQAHKDAGKELCWRRKKIMTLRLMILMMTAMLYFVDGT